LIEKPISSKCGVIVFDVSIVIPTVEGRENLLERAVASINEPNLDIEILIIRDGDESERQSDLVDGRSCVVRELAVHGRAAVGMKRNVGIDCARGEFVAFLDDDDEFLPRKLEHQLAVMRRTLAKWSFTNYLLCEETDGWHPQNFSCRAVLRSSQDFGRNCPIAMPTVVVLRDFLNSELQFNNELTVREDVDLWTRLLHRSPVLYIPEAMSVVNRRVDAAFLAHGRRVRQASPRKKLSQLVNRIRVRRDRRDSRTGATHLIHNDGRSVKVLGSDQ